MPDLKKKRAFLLRNADGRNVDVEARLDTYFAITSQNGSNHGDIVAAAPEEIRSEIEALVAVHLCAPDGTPMHAEANAAYHLREGRFDEAARALNSVTSVESLYEVFGKASRKAKDPATVAEYLQKPINLAKTTIERRRRHMNGETTVFGTPKENQRHLDEIAAMLGVRSVRIEGLADIAAGKFDDKTKERVAGIVGRRAFDYAVKVFVNNNCRTIWAARAAAAIAILDKPDYRAEGRPAIADDPTTFEGYVAKFGIEMTTARAAAKPGDRQGQTRWVLSFRGKRAPEKILNIEFSKGNAAPPKIEEVLECLQREFHDVSTYELDDFINEFGLAGDIKAIRRAEAAYTLQRDEQIPLFREIVGDEGLRALLTSVGDDPPSRPEDYDGLFASAPAPKI